MSPSQQAVLRELEVVNWVSARDLSRRTGYELSTVRRVIQELRRRGFRISNDGDSHNEGAYRLHVV